jgi:hypothetical protein
VFRHSWISSSVCCHCEGWLSRRGWSLGSSSKWASAGPDLVAGMLRRTFCAMAITLSLHSPFIIQREWIQNLHILICEKVEKLLSVLDMKDFSFVWPIEVCHWLIPLWVPPWHGCIELLNIHLDYIVANGCTLYKSINPSYAGSHLLVYSLGRSLESSRSIKTVLDKIAEIPVAVSIPSHCPDLSTFVPDVISYRLVWPRRRLTRNASGACCH